MANIVPYLKAIKSAISTAKTEAINSAKTYTDTVAGTTLQSAKDYTDTKLSQLDVLGEYKGSGATLAELNALTGKGKGDLAILTAKDGSNKPGIYVFNDTTSSFEFVIEIKSADAQALVDGVLTKIGDLANLTTTEKSTLVGAINELVTRLNGIDTSLSTINTAISGFTTSISTINAKFDDYALKNGNDANTFLVADASAQTKQAVNASQFDFTITDAEAADAWAAA
jgi:hypothetical protein